jgi:hypothetical protein
LQVEEDTSSEKRHQKTADLTQPEDFRVLPGKTAPPATLLFNEVNKYLSISNTKRPAIREHRLLVKDVDEQADFSREGVSKLLGIE